MTQVGRVLGTAEAHPLDFWVGVEEGQYLQLDDVVAVTTRLPDGQEVTLYGIVDLVRARYEGAKFDSDVFRVAEGILPVGIATAAHVAVTRVEPEIFVPPTPGLPVRRALDQERERALFFDAMGRRFPAGLSRDGQVAYANLEFLDGTRGAHVNISGVSGVATKTSYALYLLYALFHSDALGTDAANARAIIFNVKGEDLLFLDKANARLGPDDAEKYIRLGLPAGPFASVGLWAPVQREAIVPVADTGSRQEGITAYYWTLREFCQERFLRFLFAEADAETSQLSFVINQVERHIQEATEGLALSSSKGQPAQDGWVMLDGQRVTSFSDLVDYIHNNLEEMAPRAAAGTLAAFARRLQAAADSVGHLLRGEAQMEGDRHRIDWRQRQVNVIDIHNLPDRAKRFVVGVVLKRLIEEKEKLGSNRPLVFVVLDELNKYAPREGWSPIKEVVLDMAERGRSLGVILIGAQQTASEVERRVVANASFRVVGRLDAGEAERGEYGFLPGPSRARSLLLKPGSMFLHQPQIPIPLLIQFPFPSWATRREEVSAGGGRAEEIPKGFER